MRYRFGCDLSYEVTAPTLFVFNVEAARIPHHRRLSETLTLTPDYARRIHVVPGNDTRYLAINAEPGPFNLHYEASVDLDVLHADPASIAETPVSDLPLEVLPYLLPSRFVSSDRLASFALREFGQLDTGFERVTSICNWICANIDYKRGTSDGETTADESLLLRAGVCRDFSHIAIAFCRALGIPARFVSCYAYGLVPPDFHAIFEAYMGGRWWLFDATRQADLDGLVRIGVGRDAAEIAFCTPFGQMQAGPVNVFIERLDGEGESAPRTTDAVSTDESAPPPEH
ncbi:transglutaminase family protein [Fulvimarina sp. 2208YS6-2-32]|uniref:Transglutaminase family protein n=1 Tax=Fulvimarina uroteuthidis TaxID=3098149 RepID=A0ABU5I4C6_9HYPH|nr:transglutaminase family protein [Fulvimarina sp. 2208YS6-2-32]MDY8110233.1 transglutaminase family protein [Fulvimarina sp. 2208YS6-2-32]